MPDPMPADANAMHLIAARDAEMLADMQASRKPKRKREEGAK